jgi:hypothetical protein
MTPDNGAAREVVEGWPRPQMTKSSKLSPRGPSASSTLIYIKIRHPLCPQISMCRATVPYVPALSPASAGLFLDDGA